MRSLAEFEIELGLTLFVKTSLSCYDALVVISLSKYDRISSPDYPSSSPRSKPRVAGTVTLFSRCPPTGVPSHSNITRHQFFSEHSAVPPSQSPYKNRVFTCRPQARRQPIPQQRQIIDAMKTDGSLYIIRTQAPFGWAVPMGVQKSNER
jgi:hypothetical protein